MRVVEHPFSELLRDPKKVTGELDHGDVLLRRRGASALRLSRADRDDERASAFDALARLLHYLASHNPAAMEEAALDAFPWATLLPERDAEQFISEFTRTLLGSAELKNFAPVTQLLNEWRATAEVHADPRLAQRLRRSIEAGGDPVPAPPR